MRIPFRKVGYPRTVYGRTLSPAEERAMVLRMREIVTAETIDQRVAGLRGWLSSTNAGNYISETGKDDVLAVLDYFTNSDPERRYE